MVWIAVGCKGQDLALNYALFCLYFWLNGFHLSMPGNNILVPHKLCVNVIFER